MSRIGTRAAAGLLAAMCLAHVARAAGRDKVKLTNGRTQVGSVRRDDAEGVTVRFPQGGSAEYSRDQVASVEYAGTPNEYTVGFRHFENDNYEGAIRYLGMAQERRHPELLTQYILYYTAKSHQKLNEPDQAIPAFEGIVDQGAKSRFLNEAFRSLIELYADVDRIDEARKIWRKLPAPRTKAEKLNRLMLRAMIEEKDKRPKKAMELYRQAKRESSVAHREEAATAAMGVARCMLALKKHEQTVREVEGLVKGGKLGEHYAEAYVILGDALMAIAKTDEGYEAAILAYLRVPALYPGDEATEAKALLQAGQAYRLMTGSEQAKKRAAKLFAMLRDKYPDSSYAEEARR